MLKRFIESEDGATAIEYALIATGISIAIAVVIFTMGSSLNKMFTNVSNIF